MTHDLCERHADGLSVPRGWQLRGPPRPSSPLPPVRRRRARRADRPPTPAACRPRAGASATRSAGWLVAESRRGARVGRARSTGLGYLEPIGQAAPRHRRPRSTGRAYDAAADAAVAGRRRSQAVLWLGLLGVPLCAAADARATAWSSDFGLRVRAGRRARRARSSASPSSSCWSPLVSLPWILRCSARTSTTSTSSARELADKADGPARRGPARRSSWCVGAPDRRGAVLPGPAASGRCCGGWARSGRGHRLAGRVRRSPTSSCSSSRRWSAFGAVLGVARAADRPARARHRRPHGASTR